MIVVDEEEDAERVNAYHWNGSFELSFVAAGAKGGGGWEETLIWEEETNGGLGFSLGQWQQYPCYKTNYFGQKCLITL